MRILITGTTARHVGKLNAFTEEITPQHYSTVPHIFAKACGELGHEVEMRPVSPVEKITKRHYDRVFVLLGPINDPGMTFVFSALTALARRRDAVILLNDWKIGSLKSSVHSFIRNRHYYMWRSPFAKGRRFYAEAFERRDMFEDLVKELGDYDKPWKRLVVLPMFPWGDPRNVKNCPESSYRAMLDYSPGLRVPRFVNPRKKQKHWVLGVLNGYTGNWLKKQRFTWPIRRFGHRAERVSEDHLVQEYANAWGVVVPRYATSASGWWRPRYAFAAKTGSILYVAYDDAAIAAGGPFDYVLPEIENAKQRELHRIAEDQGRWLKDHLWSKQRWHIEVQALITGNIGVYEGTNRA